MKPRLLLIDEPTPYLFFVKDVMVRDGFEAKIQENANGLKNVLNEFSPDLVLIDVHMNNCMGFEILSKIKVRYKYSNPIIVISSSSKVREIEKAFELGAYDYLIKPLNLRDLRNKVQQALAKQRFKKNDCHA